MDQDADQLQIMYKAHILDGTELLQKLEDVNYRDVRGIHKLERKIQKDILFLSETLQSKNLKKEHLVCSNLQFYRAIVQQMLNQPACEAVLETFSYKMSNGCENRLTVDVVSCKGQQWIKVIARNPVALYNIYKEGDSFGRRSIMDQAISYVQAAAQNLHLFCPPQVVFFFVNGVPEKMKSFLERLGIRIEGKVITIGKDTLSSSSLYSDMEEDKIIYTCDLNSLVPVKQISLTRLNLCITTMIAYVSALTNGGCNHRFMEPLLNQQAEWERNGPVKPVLSSLFEGKELICCSTAKEDFKNIVNMVGGEEERNRADDLLSNIKIVPDVAFPGLKHSGKIKKRSLLIFGTGSEHKAVTVTANKGFVHASKQKGVKFAVIIHESRALTEHKQLTESF